jgi:hypothetical protein
LNIDHNDHARTQMDVYTAQNNEEIRKNYTLFKSVSLNRSKGNEDQLGRVLIENSVPMRHPPIKEVNAEDLLPTSNSKHSPGMLSKLQLYKFHSK